MAGNIPSQPTAVRSRHSNIPRGVPTALEWQLTVQVEGLESQLAEERAHIDSEVQLGDTLYEAQEKLLKVNEGLVARNEELEATVIDLTTQLNDSKLHVKALRETQPSPKVRAKATKAKTK